MVPSDLQSENITVSKSESFEIYRQTIRPPDQVGIVRLFEALWMVLRRGRFTGQVTLHLNQGGIRDIVTEQKIEK